MAKGKNQNREVVDDVENALTRTEQYIEENQKSLMIIVAAIIVIVGGYLGYQRFLVAPQEKEASAQMFMAERYFEQDSFRLALNGDGMNYGFLDIIDEYSITKSANLASYYAGISYLNLGEYEEAIDYLKDFDSTDEMVGPVSIGAMGDAHAELGEYDKALSMYKKAASKASNEFLSPIYLMKAGILYEQNGEYDKALEVYQEIEKEYKESREGRQIEKYIARVKQMS